MPGYDSSVLLVDILNAHGPYLSDADEADIEARLAVGADVADLAVRTCLCGARLDGFDAYHAHLVHVLTAAAERDQ